jgi:hypothetical protein
VRPYGTRACCRADLRGRATNLTFHRVVNPFRAIDPTIYPFRPTSIATDCIAASDIFAPMQSPAAPSAILWKIEVRKLASLGPLGNSSLERWFIRPGCERPSSRRHSEHPSVRGYSGCRRGCRPGSGDVTAAGRRAVTVAEEVPDRLRCIERSARPVQRQVPDRRCRPGMCPPIKSMKNGPCAALVVAPGHDVLPGL